MSHGNETTSPQNVRRNPAPTELTVRGKLATKISSFLLGYDLFISYPRSDANTYALRLANQLTKLGFRCYLDQFSSSADRQLPERVKEALRQSRGMVVVGSPEALNSYAILEELRIFSSLSRPILPINVEGTLTDESWDNLILGLSRTDESEAALTKGRPSRHVLTRLNDSINFRRRNAQLKRTFLATLSGVALLIVAGALTVFFFSRKVEAARANALAADQARVKAENLAHDAQIRLTETTGKLTDVSGKLSTATSDLDTTRQTLITVQGQELAARTRADQEARRAELQHRVVVSQNLIASATAQLKFDPEASVLLARDAFAASPSEDTGEILRRSLLGSHAGSVVENDESCKFIVFDAAGQYAATLDYKGKIKIWNAKAGTQLAVLTVGSVAPAGPAQVELWSLSFSPDGKYVAATANHDTAYLWAWEPEGLRNSPKVLRRSENDACRSLRCSEPDGDRITTIAFTPDSQYVATAGGRGEIGIWQTYSGTLYRRLEEHKDAVNEIVFSPRDGRFLASAGADEKTLLWDWRDPRDPVLTKGIVRRLQGCNSELDRGTSTPTEYHYRVNNVAFDATGKHLVTVSDCWFPTPGLCDGKFPVAIYSVDTGEVLNRLQGHKNGTYGASFSPDGNYVLTFGGDSTAKVWNWADLHGRPVILNVGTRMSAAAFSPNGRFIATAGWDGLVRLWQSGIGFEARGAGNDATLNTSIATFVGHKLEVRSVGFTPNGRQIMSTGLNDQTARLWNIDLQNEIVSIKDNGGASNVALSPDGKRLVTSGSSDSSLQIWELNELDKVGSRKEIKAGPNVSLRSPSFSPDGKYVMAAGRVNTSGLTQGGIYLWNWREDDGSQKEPLFAPATGLVGKVEFSHDQQGRYVLAVVTDQKKGVVQVWDRQLSAAPLVKTLGPFERLASAALSFDAEAQYIAVATEYTFQVIDWRTDATYDLTHPHFGNYVAVAFSADNKYVAALGNSIDVWEWQSSSGREHPLLMNSDGINVPFLPSIAFSPNSAFMITNGKDSIARIWSVRTGSLVMRLGGDVSSSAPDAKAFFSNDGTRILVTDSAAVRIYQCEECGAKPTALPSFVGKHVSQPRLLAEPSKLLRELNLPRRHGTKTRSTASSRLPPKEI